jgi:Flp pilus assembly protein TadG
MSWSTRLLRKVGAARRDQGSSIVEFALTIVVVMSLLLGVMQICLAFYTYEVMNEYARAGARFAMVHGSNCFLADHTTPCKAGTNGIPTVQTVVQGYNYPGINPANLTVTPSNTFAPGQAKCLTTGCLGTGDQVTVTVSYTYKLAVPFIPSKSWTMSSSSTMIISQ